MSKLLNYLGILATIEVIAFLMGLVKNTGTSAMLSWLSNPSILFSSSFYGNLTNVLTLFVATGIIVGFFFSQKTDLAALTGMASLLFLIGWDILIIYQNLKDINSDFALLLISPLLLIYLMAVIEWWRNQA